MRESLAALRPSANRQASAPCREIATRFSWLTDAKVRDGNGRKPSHPEFDGRTVSVPPDILSKLSGGSALVCLIIWAMQKACISYQRCHRVQLLLVHRQASSKSDGGSMLHGEAPTTEPKGCHCHLSVLCDAHHWPVCKLLPLQTRRSNIGISKRPTETSFYSLKLGR